MRLVAVSLSAAVLLGAAAPLAHANVVGGDLQNFNAVPGGIDFVTVHSSETLAPGFFNVSLMLNHAVNSLPYYEDEEQHRLSYNDALTMADLGMGWGVADDVEIGFAVQSLLAQKVSEEAAHGEFTSRGVINYRAYAKLRVLGTDAGGVAVVGSAVFNHVRNNPYVGQGGSPVGILELAADTTIQKVAVAVNVGYRFRKRGEPIETSRLRPIGNQVIGSAAVSYLLPFVDTKLVAEIYGSRPAHKSATGIEKRESSSAEALLGVKHDVTSQLALHVGGGTELINGAASPDWRAYGGVNWAFGSARPRPAAVDQAPPPVFQPVAPQEERAILRNIKFAFGSDQVPPDAVPELEELARAINLAPFQKIVVEGHTDSVGSEQANQVLSEKRARTVRQWLVDNAGVPAEKIEAVGYGELQPIADNGNFQGREQNRRVEVRVTR